VEILTLVIIFATISFASCIFMFIKMTKANMALSLFQRQYDDNIIKIQNLENILEEKQNIIHQLSNNLSKNEVKLQELYNRNSDWETLKQESIKAANAAIFDAGNKLTTNLLKQHQEVSESNVKNMQENFTNNSKVINEQVVDIVKAMTILNSQVSDSQKQFDIIKRALITPQGAGSLAELTLENLLKSSGLIMGVDYLLQQNMAGNFEEKLRPDAIILLPNNNVIIVDCKSSKYFYEQAENKDVDDKFKNTMDAHLKNLHTKDYKNAVKNYLTKHHNMPPNHISTIMFLPSDTAVGTVTELDSSFLIRSWESEIIPLGPSGLVNILSYAKLMIHQNMQHENYEKILEQIKKLLGAISNIHEYGNKLGVNIKNTMQAYDKFAASFNYNVIRAIKNIENYGIISNKNKLSNQTVNLSRYQFVLIDEPNDNKQISDDSKNEEDSLAS
jgi:DNA recombination protein RmuC